MYLQCKHGFVECDRWDGTLTNHPVHDAGIVNATRRGGKIVIVVRSRSEGTIAELLKLAGIKVKRYTSPPDWDYPFRVYLTGGEFQRMITAVVAQIDYRNFKNWCASNSPEQSKLARDIWHAAHAAGRVP